MRNVRVAARFGSPISFGLPISPWKQLMAIIALIALIVLPVYFASAEPAPKNVLILHNWIGIRFRVGRSWSPPFVAHSRTG